jgi:hypothetical protein
MPWAKAKLGWSMCAPNQSPMKNAPNIIKNPFIADAVPAIWGKWLTAPL